MKKAFSELIHNKLIKNEVNYLYRDKNNEKKIIFNNVIFTNIMLNDNLIIWNESSYQISQIFTGGLNIDSIQFVNCIFKKETIFKTTLNYNYQIEKCNFDIMKFKKIHKKERTQVGKYYKYKIEIINTNGNVLNIENCEFNSKFYINPQYNNFENRTCEISSLIIEETVFNENFKLHDCEVSLVNINNTDFLKNADFFKSKFLQEKKDITFKSINFGGLALFGECKFYSTFIMEYVTITGLSHFREAEFFAGLNLDKSNIEKEMNFFNIKGLKDISIKNDTSQETYRILKFNCEKIGNIIEANKYHALELEKKKETIKFNDNETDWMVFQANYLTSRFGTHWVYPIVGILLVGLLTLLGLHYEKLSELYDSTDLINGTIFWSGLDKAFEYMYILNKDKNFQEHGFIFLLNKISLGYLYYQFVTAIRKDTRK